ncbi:MAG: GNAT family N-acetyltransferase [Pseudomonadota bacterium]
MLTKLALDSKAVWGYSPEFMAACRAELTVDETKLSDTRFQYWVSEDKQEILGFYALEKQSDTTFELEALFVTPGSIGKGVGRALLEHAKAQAASEGATTLTIQGDPNAEKFYRAAGAQRVGELESASIPGRFLPLFELRIEGN